MLPRTPLRTSVVELLRALGALAEPPSPQLQRVADALDLGPLPDASDHTDLFLFQLPPFASIYVGGEGKLGGTARDRIAGFWRAVGQSPPKEPDALGALLGLYATLAEAGADEPDPATSVLIGESASALLHEHLTPWLPAYVASLASLAPPFYGQWGRLLMDAIGHEASRLDPDRALPVHLGEAPALPDPRRDGGAAFLEALLAPVRSGIILTRTDLARAARATRLGLRAGERRYALEALLAQDAEPVLGWLGSEARGWARIHRGHAAVAGRAATGFWAERAERTERLLASLTADAEETSSCAP